MNHRILPHPWVRPGRQRGFTLIEVMVVAAIVAVLAAVAIPSYTSYVARGKRADARGQLLQAAQFMQRFYAANDRYDADRGGTAVENVMPAGLKQSPQDSATPAYTLTVQSSTTFYTLTMAPQGSMSNDKCGSYRLTADGARANIVGGATVTATVRQECWNK